MAAGEEGHHTDNDTREQNEETSTPEPRFAPIVLNEVEADKPSSEAC